MEPRQYVSWVEPIAATLREQRSELVELVRAVPEAAWAKPSPNEAWTYRHLLGHLGTRDARDWRLVLTSVVTRTPLDPADFPFEDDELNEGLLGELSKLSPVEVVERLEADTEELLDLLSRLTDQHEGLRQQDFPMSLGEALSEMTQHARMHMEQLRTAIPENA